MSLSRLTVENLRNIKHVELGLASGINLFCGNNGSGKTSLLESVYLLGSGRTFRGQS
jgi:DNA replication and repair protein RecF